MPILLVLFWVSMGLFLPGKGHAQSLRSIYSFAERPLVGHQLLAVDSLEYDAMGRLSRKLNISVAAGQLWVISRTCTYQYNANGQLSTEECWVHHVPNPLDSARRTTFVYDASGALLQSFTWKVVQGSWQQLERQIYVYNGLQRITDIIAQKQFDDTWRDVAHRRFNYHQNGLLLTESLHRRLLADTLQRVEERFFTYDAQNRIAVKLELQYDQSDIQAAVWQEEVFSYQGNSTFADSLRRTRYTAIDTNRWVVVRSLLPNDSIDLVQTFAVLPYGLRLVAYDDFKYGMATSVEDLSALAVRVYPNPFADALSVHNDMAFAAQAQLYATNGKRIKQFTLQPGENSLELSQLPAGMYLLHVQAGKQSAFHKLVKPQ